MPDHNIDVPKLSNQCLENLHELHMLLHQFLQTPPDLESFTSTPKALQLLVLDDSIQMTTRKLQEVMGVATQQVENG